MQRNTVASSSVRLAEVMAALSLATDLGMGQPLDFALCSCLLATRLGEALRLREDDLRDAYYYALLRYVGCTAETHVLAAFFGDELALRQDFATLDLGNTPEMLSFIFRHVREAHAGQPPLHFARLVAQGLVAARSVTKREFSGHCEVAQRLATRLGFGQGIVEALGQLYERWDGRGLPKGRRGEDVALPARLVTLAQDMVIFNRLHGVEAAVAMARQRKGTAYDPQMAERFCQQATQLLAGLNEELSLDTLLEVEPGARPVLSEAELDTACLAMADFADLKSPYTLCHSQRVSELAADAARACGLPESEIHVVRRAGWLHELGRVGISTAVLVKTGPLSEREHEQVRLHTYYTERVLARSQALSRLGTLGSLHHERLDGSGYHRGATANTLPPAARVLAAANAYQAAIEPRPHRPAQTPEVAADNLRREVRAGRLDSDSVSGVLEAAGHRVRTTRREAVAGLSEREIEVLKLMARGHSMKQIAEHLSISPKTVDNHIQHIYEKIGVSTRAGATLFAVEQHLLSQE